MNGGEDPALNDLVQEVRALIDSNRQFLEKLKDDDFPLEEEPAEEFEEL
jgi:hypothetical protein